VEKNFGGVYSIFKHKNRAGKGKDPEVSKISSLRDGRQTCLSLDEEFGSAVQLPSGRGVRSRTTSRIISNSAMVQMFESLDSFTVNQSTNHFAAFVIAFAFAPLQIPQPPS
jgi:hypothetical protein